MLKKSVIIAGRHSTSISIEPEFYAELVRIAMKKNCSINTLITRIDEQKGSQNNLSSAIRVYVLNFFKNNPVLDGESD
ncbi:MAG: ribbon-helix-helix domain-containing protein [Alphaproteobacteria bacterium]|nr:ribbon-helix-helix domain-containing protein [Alphaproteobacteria bacterium]